MTRQALDHLLAHFPDKEVEWIGPPLVAAVPDDPWLSVKFKDHPVIHIWRYTGACYYEDEGGAVCDDPFLSLPKDG